MLEQSARFFFFQFMQFLFPEMIKCSLISRLSTAQNYLFIWSLRCHCVGSCMIPLSCSEHLVVAASNLKCATAAKQNNHPFIINLFKVSSAWLLQCNRYMTPVKVFSKYTVYKLNLSHVAELSQHIMMSFVYTGLQILSVIIHLGVFRFLRAVICSLQLLGN